MRQLKAADADFLAGKGDHATNTGRVSGAGIVAIVLVLGGAAYLAIFLWITVTRVREEAPNMWPPEDDGHKPRH